MVSGVVYIFTGGPSPNIDSVFHVFSDLRATLVFHFALTTMAIRWWRQRGNSSHTVFFASG